MSGSPAEVGSWQVFPVRLGNSGLSLSRRAQYETAIATGNGRFLLYLSEAEDVGVVSAGAKREERRSYLQCSLVRTG